MRIYGRLWLFILIVGMGLTSCEKEEVPVLLPDKGDSEYKQLHSGEYYSDQLYFNFATGSVVKTSPVDMWDLAFETSKEGFHVFTNGAKFVCAFNTGISSMSSVQSQPAVPLEKWLVDMPDGDPEKTAIGNWLNENKESKNEVFILHIGDDKYKKVRFVSVTDKEYVIEYGNMEDNTLQTMTIPKLTEYSHTYFSFSGGGSIVYPAPPKTTWDIVFTRYRHIYTNLEDFPYVVYGALLNPYNTEGYIDSTGSYDAMNINTIPYGKMTERQDVIGFEWKIYDFDKGKYYIDDKKFYVLKTQEDEYWKIRFRDFYDKNGTKGSPAFEYVRIK